MKIRKIKAESFGCLKNFESPQIDKSLVVVLGDNEAGKSTLFKLISTIFYGWSPVSDNPYVPWDGQWAGCEAELTDESGLEFNVYRKLRSKPEGSLLIKEKKLDIGNRALDQLGFLPLKIFNDIYALSVDKLCFPDEDAWKGLQDELLGGQYRSMLYPVSLIKERLYNDASALWRPNNVGKPKEKLLHEEYRKLKQRLVEARENEKTMYRIEAQIEDINHEIDRTFIRKINIIKFLDRFERLYPVQKKLKKINELMNKASDIKNFEHIQGNVLEILNELGSKKQSMEAEYTEINELRKDFECKINLYTPADRAIYVKKDNISLISRSYSQIEYDISNSTDLNIEIERQTSKLKYRAGDFLIGGWKDSTASILESIDEVELRESIKAFKDSDSKYQEHNARLTGLKGKKGKREIFPMFLIIPTIISLLGIAGTALYGNSVTGFISGLLLVFGLCIFLMYFILKSNGFNASEYRDAENKLNKAREEKNNKADIVKDVLKGLPASSQRMETPDESLLLDINKLKELLYNVEENIEKRNVISRRIREKNRAKDLLLEACGIEGSADILKDINMLENYLRAAEEHFRTGSNASLRLDELDKRLSDIEKDLSCINENEQNILNDLSRLNGNSIKEKVDSLMERRNYLKWALTMKEELNHDYQDMEDIKAEIASYEKAYDGIKFDDDKTAEAKAEREQIDLTLNELNKKIGSLKSELEHRQENERVDDLEGQIACINQERESLALKSDRLMLLRNVLNEADRVFREENQPDVLQRAGKYIELITAGRYNRILLSDGDSSELLVKSNYRDEFLYIEKQRLSRGTREQIYLALRLALADHLDSENESLPLFLDEVLINWDEIRVENGLKLLNEISQKRQVFLFTCHKNLAKILEGYRNVQFIQLQ